MRSRGLRRGGAKRTSSRQLAVVGCGWRLEARFGSRAGASQRSVARGQAARRAHAHVPGPHLYSRVTGRPMETITAPMSMSIAGVTSHAATTLLTHA